MAPTKNENLVPYTALAQSRYIHWTEATAPYGMTYRGLGYPAGGSYNGGSFATSEGLSPEYSGPITTNYSVCHILARVGA